MDQHDVVGWDSLNNKVMFQTQNIVTDVGKLKGLYLNHNNSYIHLQYLYRLGLLVIVLP